MNDKEEIPPRHPSKSNTTLPCRDSLRACSESLRLRRRDVLRRRRHGDTRRRPFGGHLVLCVLAEGFRARALLTVRVEVDLLPAPRAPLVARCWRALRPSPRGRALGWLASRRPATAAAAAGGPRGARASTAIQAALPEVVDVRGLATRLVRVRARARASPSPNPSPNPNPNR